MKFQKSLKFFVIFALMLISLNFTYSWEPQNDGNFLNSFGIYNATQLEAENITADDFFGNFTGSFIIEENLNINNYSIYNASEGNFTTINAGNEGNLNVNSSNSSTFWASVNSFSLTWFNDISNVFTFNETKLDSTIITWDAIYNASMKTYVDAQDIIFNESMKNYSNTQNNLLNTSLITYINSQDSIFNNSMKTYTDNTFITQANEGNLNVNKSNYWNNLNTSSDITGLDSSNIISMNWTRLQNYPVACPADTYITTIGDTTTCTGISDVYLSNEGDIGNGDYTFNGNIIMNGNVTIISDTFNATVETQILNGTFEPNLDNIFDIGTSTKRWNDGFFGGIVKALTLNGNLDASNITSGTIASERILDDYLSNRGDIGIGFYNFTGDIELNNTETKILTINNANPEIVFEGDTTTTQLTFIDSLTQLTLFTADFKVGQDIIASKNIIAQNITANENIITETLTSTTSEINVLKNLNMTNNNVTDTNCIFLNGLNICNGCINFTGAGEICGLT